jgi:patatin-related protein
MRSGANRAAVVPLASSVRESPVRPETRAELRLALAMRGGVSLAVWIGGACAEIDALRRAGSGPQRPEVTSWLAGEAVRVPSESDQDAARMYQVLVRAAGFEGVTIDVISGASAGGLNGAILSATLAYGARFDEMRRLWLEVADIEKVMRSATDPKPPSLMMGDEYFLKHLDRQLDRIIAAALSDPAYPPVERLDLFLSATLMRPVKIPVAADPFDKIVETRQVAGFHFRKHGPEGSCLSDFSGDHRTVARRLAVAARSTSSFPGAFEPARVTARRPSVIGARPPDDRPDDLFGIFSETGAEPFDVIDGGVLDNIPIERAIRAIAAAPASGPTERWLLFLHPSPEAGSDSAVPSERPGALKTVVTALSTKSNQESMLDDIRALNRHNLAAGDYQRLRNELLRIGDQSRPVQDLISEADLRYGDYRKLRGKFAAGVIRELLDDPVAFLQGDPFPQEVGSPLAGWNQGQRDGLEQAVEQVRASLLPKRLPGSPTQLADLDLGAVSRMSDLLADWSRDVEARAATAGSPDEALRATIGTLKRGLYEARALSELLLQYDDIFWVLHAGRTTPDPSRELFAWAKETFRDATRVVATHPAKGPAADLLRRLAGYLFLASEAQQGLPSEEVARRRDKLSDDAAKAMCRVERLIAKRTTDLLLAPDQEDKPESAASDVELDMRAGVWVYLLTMAVFIAQSVKPLELSADPVFRLLEGAPYERIDTAKLLATIEVLTFPVAMAFPTTQPINFRRIAATSHTPLEGLFPGGTLEPRRKLAGNELANFAAFYKASWRANDWMWGRLDAVPSLIDLLLQPDRLRRHFLPEITDPVTKAARFSEILRALATAPVLMEPPSSEQEANLWRDHFSRLWGRCETAVARESHDLFAGTGEPRLDAIKGLLIERRHWELMLTELPLVAVSAAEEEGVTLASLPPTRKEPGDRLRRAWRWLAQFIGRSRQQDRVGRRSLPHAIAAVQIKVPQPLRDPIGVKEVLGRYRVGEQTIQDELGTNRTTELLANLAQVGWNAFAGPAGGVFRPIGWIVKLTRLLALTVARAPRWALMLAPLVAVMASYLAITGRELFGLGRPVMAVVAVGAIGVLLYWASSLPRLVLFLSVFGPLAWAALRLEGSADVRLRLLPWTLVDKSGLDLRWPIAVALLLAAIVLFERLPYARRPWVGLSSTGLGLLVVGVSLLPPVREQVTWGIVAVALAGAVTIPAIVEALFDRARRRGGWRPSPRGGAGI